MTDTRINICFAMNPLRHVHLIAAKHILRYLKGTVDYGLKYEANQKINLEVMRIRIGKEMPLKEEHFGVLL